MARRRDDPSVSGIVLIDKPTTWTSHDVVGWLRARLGVRRIGHSGTLDPLASGLLPCLVGSCTRLVDYLHDWPKSYVGVIVLGHETPTGDAEGLDDAERAPRVPTPPSDVLERARLQVTGEIAQVPPAFSAKKLRGIPSHRLARSGRAAPLAPSRVTVHRLRLRRLDDGRLAFAARVSSGTYLRSLARDLGRLLGTGAFLDGLRRTGIGPLRVRAALRPRPRGEEQPTVALGEPASIPLPMPTACLDAEGAERFAHGRGIEISENETHSKQGPRRVVDERGRLLGVAERTQHGQLRPRVVLVSPGEPVRRE